MRHRAAGGRCSPVADTQVEEAFLLVIRNFVPAAAALALAAMLGPPDLAHAGDRPVGQPFATRSEVVAQHGMAATSQPLATQVALDVLKQGGNAVDAAIAANAVIGLVEPTGAGIGGDLFAIVWDPRTQKLHALNASGRSPQALSLDWFRSQGMTRIPSHGALSVSVPGAVDGWAALHERFGPLPLSTLLAPAIGYARDGFPVTPVISKYWAGGVEDFQDYPGFRETFTVDGRAPKAGEVFKNPGLARTLEAVATGGRDAFYEGPIARTIADTVQRQGGFLSTEDLAAHHSDWVEPISTNYRGYDVWELPPNGQGLAVLQMLELLEGYDLAAMGPGSADYLHTLVEAKKLVYEDRAHYYADPAFAKVPVAELLSEEYAARRRALIDPGQALREVDHGDPMLRHGDTIYLTVADASGTMVSLIQSNFGGMGSGVIPEGLGFMLQNRGQSFSLDPQHANAFAAGKRPFHTIIPGFVTKQDQPWLAFGVMGGDMQPQGQVQVLVNAIDFGMDLQEAGDAPRVYHAGSSEPTGEHMADGGTVFLESGIDPAVVADLKRRGHTVGTERASYGGYQAIGWDAEQRVFHGASESRKDGMAAGF